MLIKSLNEPKIGLFQCGVCKLGILHRFLDWVQQNEIPRGINIPKLTNFLVKVGDTL